MSSFNKTILLGRVATDLEVKFTNAGKKVANFRIAVGRGTKDAEGKWQSDFFNVELWEAQAEQAEQRLQKGSRVIVEGALRTESWADKESGQKREKVKVTGSFRTIDKPASNEDEG